MDAGDRLDGDAHNGARLNPEIAVVVFDLGGVMCRFAPRERLRALGAACGLEEGEVHERIWGSGLDAAFDRGEFGLEQAMAAAINALGANLELDDLLAAWSLAFPLDHAVAKIVADITCRRAVFTNNGPLLEACVRRGLVPLTERVDALIFAWRLGALKPDPASYVAAAAGLATRPEELLLIDDTKANVAGAIESGWKALHFRDPQGLRRDLEDLGTVLCDLRDTPGKEPRPGTDGG